MNTTDHMMSSTTMASHLSKRLFLFGFQKFLFQVSSDAHFAVHYTTWLVKITQKILKLKVLSYNETKAWIGGWNNRNELRHTFFFIPVDNPFELRNIWPQTVLHELFEAKLLFGRAFLQNGSDLRSRLEASLMTSKLHPRVALLIPIGLEERRPLNDVPQLPPTNGWLQLKMFFKL